METTEKISFVIALVFIAIVIGSVLHPPSLRSVEQVFPGLQTNCTSHVESNKCTICPPADFPVNAHIDCSSDGILLYVPGYLTHKNYTYSVKYDNTSPYNGTWILSSGERNTGNNSVVLAWCE